MAGHKGPNGKFMRVPMEERFWPRVDTSGGPDACWPWTGPIEWTGYGRITDYWKKVSTHRLAYELAIGPIPPGRQVCHRCDFRACCNPSHLFIGSASDNMQDAKNKGRLHGYRPDHPLCGSQIGTSKLTEEGVRDIRRRAALGHIGVGRKTGATEPNSLHTIAADYGVSVSAIHSIVTGKTWRHVT